MCVRVCVCVPPVLGNWFAVIAGSPEFIARAAAVSCPRWRERKMEKRRLLLLLLLSFGVYKKSQRRNVRKTKEAVTL